MRTAKADLPAMRFGDYEGRTIDEGPLRIAFESMPAGFPPDPSVFEGLPDDRCQCPHHGYLVRGSARVTYLDGREEVINAGDAYVLEPGHFVQTIEDCEFVEFSPVAEHDVTRAQIMRNVEQIERAAGAGS
ncbi:MAG TPA: hypothetical protein VHB30_14720 [Solirubrobacteraceae bacterium]|jgi:hypothetical protein|nr:hypothetical protein [Solirubrobacteraceae bacterium]